MKKLCRLGDLTPVGYRVAYYDYLRDFFVFYPFGMHWIVRMVRRLWERSFEYNQSKLEKAMREQYLNGKNRGMFLVRNQIEQKFDKWYADK